MDEYVLGENRVPAGLYRIAHDEDGTRKVIFDDPAKEDSKPKAAPKAAESPEDDETPLMNGPNWRSSLRRWKA